MVIAGKYQPYITCKVDRRHTYDAIERVSARAVNQQDGIMRVERRCLLCGTYRFELWDAHAQARVRGALTYQWSNEYRQMTREYSRDEIEQAAFEILHGKSGRKRSSKRTLSRRSKRK